MVRVEGSLVVARRSGSRGSFSVGDLVTSIGEFKVKDAILDQFEPGEYKGEFIIKWIQPATFAWRGRVSVENRATLAEIFVHTIDERDDSPSTERMPPERDPMDERPELTQQARVQPAAAPAAPPEHVSTAIEAVAVPTTTAEPVKAAALEEDESLFGEEIYPQFLRKLQIKLDPTLDREQFRRQRDRLKASGYRFDAKQQAWQVVVEEALEPAVH